MCVCVCVCVSEGREYCIQHGWMTERLWQSAKPFHHVSSHGGTHKGLLYERTCIWMRLLISLSKAVVPGVPTRPTSWFNMPLKLCGVVWLVDAIGCSAPSSPYNDPKAICPAGPLNWNGIPPAVATSPPVSPSFWLAPLNRCCHKMSVGMCVAGMEGTVDLGLHVSWCTFLVIK